VDCGLGKLVDEHGNEVFYRIIDWPSGQVRKEKAMQRGRRVVTDAKHCKLRSPPSALRAHHTPRHIPP